MKLLNFAVASIVDANTGSGVNRHLVEQFESKDSNYEKFGREIRAKSTLGVVAKIKGAFKQFIADSKARSRETDDIESTNQAQYETIKCV